jgi:uncharacterized tellurite resistance protein B-like protein
MRPALKAGLRPLWRDRDTLQIGVDPRRAFALAGIGGAAAVVSLLDGSRDTAELERAALEFGIPAEATRRVLELLSDANALDDFPAALHRSLPAQLRARLGPDLACASLAGGDRDGGEATLARRRAASVRVYGAGRVGACVATLLAASGVARVSCRDSGAAGYADLSPGGLSREDIGVPRGTAAARAIRRAAPETRLSETGFTAAGSGTRQPDIAVLAGPVGPEEVTALLRARVPHIAVRADEAIGVVGPLVVPGHTACLRCTDLARAELDPAWPLILAQAEDRPRACDTILAVDTAALAARQALAFLDQPAPDQPALSRPGPERAGLGRAAPGPPAAAPATLNGTLELVLPGWQWRRRTWRPHPACACGASEKPGQVPDYWAEGKIRSV